MGVGSVTRPCIVELSNQGQPGRMRGGRAFSFGKGGGGGFFRALAFAFLALCLLIIPTAADATKPMTPLEPSFIVEPDEGDYRGGELISLLVPRTNFSSDQLNKLTILCRFGKQLGFSLSIFAIPNDNDRIGILCRSPIGQRQQKVMVSYAIYDNRMEPSHKQVWVDGPLFTYTVEKK